MRKLLFFSLCVIFLPLNDVLGAESLAQGLFQRDFRLKGIQSFSAESGIAYTSDSLFVKGLDGWRKLNLGRSVEQRISVAKFESESSGIVVLVTPNTDFVEVASTIDGGATWTKTRSVLPNAAFFESDLESGAIRQSNDGELILSVRIPTSSNFVGEAVYESTDGGSTWRLLSRKAEPQSSQTSAESDEMNGWKIETVGECFAPKTACVMQTRLMIDGIDMTPAELQTMMENDRQATREKVAESPSFAAPPGGSIRISLNRGFDKCQAGSTSQMQTWWNQSYFFDSNIYFSGRARACSTQPFTNNPAWINAVSNQGWGLIPTVVGYQSPCSVSVNSAKHSYDVALAEQQGRGEADIAAADAASIGLTAGSVLYYDMERYDETASTPGCRVATVAFLKGWTERIRQLGYVSGVYGSPKNAIEDWQTMPPASRMDAVWMARWDNIPSVWTYLSFSTFPNNVWDNHQRIKQWQAPHNETWGGITFNIDGNISDGPVAGIPVAKNKAADFDGDGKTDLSLFRPTAAAEWHIFGSDGPLYRAQGFGTTGDLPVPGDYDGDGKTDIAVFRPSNSTWYLLMKGVYIERAFGESGDVPMPADYNGDRRSDIAIFRPSTGAWYFVFSDSRSTYTTKTFGVNGDKPVRGDFDGDGTDDMAVWRQSTGDWYFLGTASGFSSFNWGIATDIVVPSDYDGDGKTDFAYIRNNVWTIYQSASQTVREQSFGTSGDIPVPGDFDGDGKYDIAVFRPSEGRWYLQQSLAGYAVADFGEAADKPIPAAYHP